MAHRLLISSGLVVAVLCGGPGLGIEIGTAPAAAQNKKEQSIKLKEREKAFVERVNQSVTKGVDFLKKHQSADGSYKSHFDNFLHGPFTNGMTAFCTFTLLRSGVNPQTDTIDKSFKHLREQWDNFKAGGLQPAEPTSWKIYEAACMLMALEAKYKKPTAFVQNVQKGTPLAKPRGALRGKLRRKPDRADMQWMKELAKFIQENIGLTEITNNGTSSTKVKTTWSYPTGNPDTTADRSNTQFAVLGLQAAATFGIRTDADIWEGILKNFVKYQDKKGEKTVRRIIPFEDKKNPGYIRYRTVGSISDTARGWNYYCGKPTEVGGDEWHRPMGAMTTIGISVVAICLEQLTAQGKANAKTRQSAAKAMRDGLAWLDVHYSVEAHPGHEAANAKKYLYYFLYGLERAGVSTNVPLIGSHDWYGDGAEVIMQWQQPEGQWQGDHDAKIAATCFALLFLTKGTVPPNINVKISGH
jgi:hypothetical protein